MRGVSRTRGIPPCCCLAPKYDDVLIAIEADERKPLLVDQWRSYGNSRSDYRSNAPAELDEDTHSDSSTSTGSDHKVRKPEVCGLRLIAFTFLLTTGFIIATYLLIVESRLPSLGFSLDLIHRDTWSKMQLPFEAFLNHTNVLNVIITHTGGRECHTSQSCLQRLEELQWQGDSELEMPYNFLIGGDRQTYEVRGWDYESGMSQVPQQTSLVIGFIGNYTNTVPSATQLNSAMSLIEESIRRRKLVNNYIIYGLRNLTVSHSDGEALFSRITYWPHYDTLLHML